MAGVGGIEPPTTEPESAVLPVTPHPKVRRRSISAPVRPTSVPASGQQDTVIKPIQGPIQSVRGIAGATELGDQDPVLVLDVSAFLSDALGRREAA